MARPIPLELPPRDPREELRAKLDQAPVEHAEALLAGYEVLQSLHDHGVLELIRGLLGGSEKILQIATEAVNSPEAIQGIRNLLLLAKLFGGQRSDQPAPSTLHLLNRMRSEESRRAISAALDVLENLGRRK